MIDTHCHLAFDDFAGRVDQVLADARAVGVRGCITITTSAANAQQSLDLALNSPGAGVWCSSGVHPLYADQPLDWPTIRRVAAHPRCVAWGELGLDYHYQHPPRDLQQRVLAEQLDVIRAERNEGIDKPIVVHCRESFDDLLAVFRASGLDPTRFVFHCFTGHPGDARKVLDFGSWISFTGIVTFKNATHVAEAAKLVPADRIMVETDAPFLSPEPVRTTRPNEPKFVVHVARLLANLRGVDAVDFERQLDANAERFFGIKLPG